MSSGDHDASVESATSHFVVGASADADAVGIGNSPPGVAVAAVAVDSSFVRVKRWTVAPPWRDPYYQRHMVDRGLERHVIGGWMVVYPIAGYPMQHENAAEQEEN